jgi:hypothetical protein
MARNCHRFDFHESQAGSAFATYPEEGPAFRMLSLRPGIREADMAKAAPIPHGNYARSKSD